MTDVSELSLQNSTTCENGRNMTCRFGCNGPPVILLVTRGDVGREPAVSKRAKAQWKMIHLGGEAVEDEEGTVEDDTIGATSREG